MIVVFGERAYGKVDRVPGVCYVVTIFAHLNFIPLVPLRSYIVVEGTENGGEFRGKEITTNIKSLIAGYIRVWCGAIMIIAGLIACFGTIFAADALQLNALVKVAAVVAGIGGLICLFVGGKFGAAVQFVVHVISIALWYVIQNAAAQNPRLIDTTDGVMLALLIANLMLLTYGVTRFFDLAGTARARQLLQELGAEVPPEDDGADDEPQGDKWEAWDASEDRRKR